MQVGEHDAALVQAADERADPVRERQRAGGVGPPLGGARGLPHQGKLPCLPLLQGAPGHPLQDQVAVPGDGQLRQHAGDAGDARQPSQRPRLRCHPVDGVPAVAAQPGVRARLLQHDGAAVLLPDGRVDPTCVGEVHRLGDAVAHQRTRVATGVDAVGEDVGNLRPARRGKDRTALVRHKRPVRTLDRQHPLAVRRPDVSRGEAAVSDMKRPVSIADVTEDVRAVGATEFAVQLLKAAAQLRGVPRVDRDHLAAGRAGRVLEVVRQYETGSREELERHASREAVPGGDLHGDLSVVRSG